MASILGAKKFVMMQQQVKLGELHVFGVSKYWLNDRVPTDLVSIEGFNVARLDRSWREKPGDQSAKRGGGLLCYDREHLVMNEFRFEHLNESTKDLEMQWVLLEIKEMRNLVMINIYRQP